MSKPRTIIAAKEDPVSALIASGFFCSYVRFHQPVPCRLNAEPMAEFKVGYTHQDKYRVDLISYTSDCVVIQIGGVSTIIPNANVHFVRPL